MDEQHNQLMAYVLDEPELAAIELAQLREEVESYEKTSGPGWYIACALAGLFVGAVFL